MEKKMFKLTNPQKNIWNMEFFYKNTNICNICGSGLIKEKIDINLLKKAINILVSKNDSFRIQLTYENGNPMQYFVQYEPFEIEVVNVSSDEEFRNLETIMVNEKFTLLNSPLFKFKLALFPNGYAAVVLNIHHIISDSWSLGITINEIVKIYHSLINNTEYISPTFSYIDFINSENDYINTNKYLKDKEYWKNYLSDFSNVVSMPSMSKKSSNISDSREASRLTYFIDNDMMVKINEYCKKHKLSVYSFFMSVVSVFIANSTNTNDFVIGSPILNRTNFKEKNSTGMFISTIPFRTHVLPDISFLEFATKNTVDIMSIFRHQKYSYVNIVEDVRKENDSISNLYNIAVSYQITRASEDVNNYESNWAFNGMGIDELTIHLYDLNDTGTLRIDYDYLISKYTKEDIDSWHLRILKVISQILSDDSILIKDIEYITDNEKEEILHKFNNRSLDCPLDSNIISIFEEQVAKYPNENALIYKDNIYKYEELNHIVNRFARYLFSAGVGKNDIVGVYMNKSDWFVISILAIQKLGAAYLPMHPDYPTERVSYILNDSNAKLLVADKDISLENLTVVNPKKIDLGKYDDNNLGTKISSDSFCYVIYTSGSTGKPKGVPITHSNLINFIYNLNDCFENKFSYKDNCLSVANISFDASVQELFAPLCFGATLVLYPKNTLTNIPLLIDILEKYNITFSFIPPNILDDIYNFVKINKRKFTINKLSVGVETIKNSTLNHFYELNKDIEIVNGYGPSEATICSTFYTYHYNEENSTVPIGYPLKNNNIYILNFLNNLQPIGFPGEICITGANVSKGYLNNPEMTKKSFVNISSLSDNLIYKTGDIGFWDKSGFISFIGRNDSQIKYRGHRVELNEINNTIKNIENVTNAVTIFKKINDVPAICSYVSTSSSIITPDFIKNELSSLLPYYMIPSHIILLDKLPLTPNGKIDRKNLPYIDIKPITYVKPSTLTEIKLHNIICKLLNLDNFSIYDDFFELGMDSLLAIRLSLEIYYEFKINLTVTDLFKHNTISKLALLLDSQNSSDFNIYTISKASTDTNYALSSAQKRIYYASKMANSSSLLYNISGGILIDKLLSVEKVEAIFNKIIEKNSVFRTYFSTYNGETRQFVLDKCKINVKFYDDGIVLDDDIQTIVDEFPKAFDLDFAPLLRVELHYVNNSSLILIDTHHIIMDGTSLSILISEFCDLYNGKEISDLEIDYKDYSVWENDYLNSEYIEPIKTYWSKRFKNYEIPIINLPYDNQPSDKKSYSGNKLYYKIPQSLFDSVSSLAKKYGMSNYMVFLSILYVLLYRYTGQENIVIGSPIESRYSSQLKNMIGMFVNNVVLNASVDGKMKLEQFLKMIKNLVLDSLSKQPYPYDMLLKDLKIPANTSLFDVVFAYQNENDTDLSINDSHAKMISSKISYAKFNLTVEIVPSTYNVNFEYNTDLFNEETINSIYEHYIFLLENIVDNLEVDLDDIDIITKKEDMLLSIYNKTDGEINNDTVVSIFEDIVRKNKDNIAVICDNKTLTYEELNLKANSLAHYLINIGIKPNDIVAIMANRSLETIVSMLGILKAGAAFLNLDPTYPTDRTKYYLDDSKAQYVLIQKSLRDRIDDKHKCIEIDLNNKLYTENFDNPLVKVKPYDLSYVIYTSGSTGVPKGVLLHQVGFANMVKAMSLVLDYLKEGNKHCIASVTSTPFDIFVYEIFVSLTHGLKVLMANNAEHRNPVLLDALIKKYGADVMTVTPSLMKINYDNRLNPSALSNIKHMVFGGEPLPEKFVKDLYELSDGATIYNIYGPSEITVLSNVQNLNGENRITIGPPIMNTQIHILDKNGHRLPIGVVGEIYISGVQVGLGYLGKPEMTKEKFLDNPFGDGKMYKSGDIGRWTFDGKVQCLGRIDHQVKLRGLRIELGEIESKMERINGITSSVVNKIELDGREFLCGYYVCDSDFNVTEKDVREFLRKSLPNYMVPTYIMKLDKMPYTINRKIDRKALPMPDMNNGDVPEKHEKLNPKQKKLLDIWSKLLHNNSISIDDNFFDIGGDSILAINMQIEALKDGFNFEYADIFNHPTIRDLSSKVSYKYENYLDKYDYSKIDKLLLNNTVDNISNIKEVNMGNVLLIGVTGYLGSHLIYSFLTCNDGDIYCLIRQKDNIIPYERLKNTLIYYFGESFYQKYKTRIHVLEGDISKINIGLSESDLDIVKNNVNTVINSGAIVKHFGQKDLFERINVEGTRNVVTICKTFEKRLIHVSTISISGNGEKGEAIIETPENINDKIIFSEKDLYVNQNLNNVYTITKFEAERIVLEAILQGLDAQIVRIGNISNRYSDGMFQRNVEENAFAKRLQSFINIGAFPDYSLNHEIELTPVDLCADAILKIASYTSPCNVFHIYDTKLLPIKLLIDTLNEFGYKLLPVSDTEMSNIINEILKDDNKKDILSGIIHDLDKNKRLVYTSRIKLDCSFTEKYLNYIGFYWKDIDRKYLIKYINYFKKINFFK